MENSIGAVFRRIGAAVSGTREKVFGPGRRVPMDWKTRLRIVEGMWRALKAGRIDRASLVTGLYILSHHNGRTGQCNPSYDTIMAGTGQCRQRVAKSLEQLGNAL